MHIRSYVGILHAAVGTAGLM